MTHKKLPPYNIIIEGFWGVGKSTTALELEKLGYNFIQEPIYLPSNTKDKSIWYSKKHKERQIFLKQTKTPTVLERSELSNFSYKYMKSKIVTKKKELLGFYKIFNLKNTLLVYFELPKNYTPLIKKGSVSKDTETIKIVKNKESVRLYTYWYEYILPYVLNITPLKIPSTNKKSPEGVAKDIINCIRSNRVAQVNIVVFRNNSINKSIEVLILKRVKKRGGFWQTVTGGVHIGESLKNAAKRELYEELNIISNSIQYIDFSYSFIGDEGYVLNEHVYTVILTQKQSSKIKISTEHEDLKWVKLKDAYKFLKFNDNKVAIKYAAKKIKNVVV